MSGRGRLARGFTTHWNRLLKGDVALQLSGHLVRHARQRGAMSSEHLSVDGAMVVKWASHKSPWPKQDKPGGDGPKAGGPNREVDFHWPEEIEWNARVSDESGGAAVAEELDGAGGVQRSGTRASARAGMC